MVDYFHACNDFNPELCCSKDVLYTSNINTYGFFAPFSTAFYNIIIGEMKYFIMAMLWKPNCQACRQSHHVVSQDVSSLADLRSLYLTHKGDLKDIDV